MVSISIKASGLTKPGLMTVATVISPGFVNPDALIEIETIAVIGCGG